MVGIWQLSQLRTSENLAPATALLSAGLLCKKCAQSLLCGVWRVSFSLDSLCGEPSSIKASCCQGPEGSSHQPSLSLPSPRGPPPACSPGPRVSPWGHQHCSRAGLQLPTAQPDHGPTHRPVSWPLLALSPSQGRCPMPGAGAAPVSLAAPGWGSGMGPGCQALPCHPPTETPHSPSPQVAAGPCGTATQPSVEVEGSATVSSWSRSLSLFPTHLIPWQAQPLPLPCPCGTRVGLSAPPQRHLLSCLGGTDIQIKYKGTLYAEVKEKS